MTSTRADRAGLRRSMLVTAALSPVVALAALATAILLRPPPVAWTGFAVMALIVLGLGITASLTVPRLRVAPPPPAVAADRAERLLVVADAICSPTALADAICRRIDRDVVHVVVPVRVSHLHFLTDDEARERRQAERSLAATVGLLRGRHVVATGGVGDDKPLESMTDALGTFAATHVLLAIPPEAESYWLERELPAMARALATVDVEHVVVPRASLHTASAGDVRHDRGFPRLELADSRTTAPASACGPVVESPTIGEVEGSGGAGGDADARPPLSADAQAWRDAIVARAAERRVPSLFAPRDDAVLRWDRQGVVLVALPPPALAEEERRAIAEFRLAQYLSIGWVDGERVHAERLEHEPLTRSAPDDIHLATGTAEGEILGYCAIRSLEDVPPGAPMRSDDRPLFPVEELFGGDVFRRLAVLPDVEAGRVREFGGFVKNRAIPMLEERLMRGVVELGMGIFRLAGVVADRVDAVVGSFEERVAMQNLAFFHMPLVVVRGAVPLEHGGSALYRNDASRTFFPFALLVADTHRSLERADAIDEALALPGFDAIVRLAELREDRHVPPSALLPQGGLPELSDLESAGQHALSAAERRALIEAGERLRAGDLFRDLSRSEAAVLGTLLVRVELAAGDVAVRAGDAADALFVVESGALDVLVDGARVSSLAAGDVFGEIGLLADGVRTADVAATEPSVLLRLDREQYLRFLATLPDVRVRAAALASSRLRGEPTLLATLASGDAALLGSHMEQLSVAAGTTIVRENDEPDGFYFVVTGEAEVRGDRLGPGDFFGELALLDGGLRTADVVAATDMTLLRLDQAGFDAFARYSDAVRTAGDTRRLGSS